MGQLLDSVADIPQGIPVAEDPFEEPPPPAALAEPPANVGGSPLVPVQLTQPPTLVESAKPGAPPPPSRPELETLRFRPVRRPPLALLCILDDGRDDGEWVRIRAPHFVIGRTEGDLVIPHDSMMSSRHAAISRVQEKERYRWYLTDLQSTNGTYLKIASSMLKHGQELLIGSRRLRFQAAQPNAEPTDVALPVKTQGWQAVTDAEMIPALVELTAQGEGQRFLLTRPENWIGRDPGQCSVVLTGDPLVSPRHARLYRDSAGRWLLEKAKTLNGTWLRIDKIPLHGTAAFQLGEQRFLLRFV
jgi:pSer/pThr/pTyr-binding forkhead associated (FHA) protein